MWQTKTLAGLFLQCSDIHALLGRLLLLNVGHKTSKAFICPTSIKYIRKVVYVTFKVPEKMVCFASPNNGSCHKEFQKAGNISVMEEKNCIDIFTGLFLLACCKSRMFSLLIGTGPYTDT